MGAIAGMARSYRMATDLLMATVHACCALPNNRLNRGVLNRRSAPWARSRAWPAPTGWPPISL